MNWLAPLPLLLAFALRLLPGPRIIDDAYITFRYAQNLARGAGLVYNPGEMVLGTTTPLYAALLAGLSRLLQTDDLPHLAWVLNALLDVVGVALVLWIGNKLTGKDGRSVTPIGLGAALLWAVAPFSVTFAIGGLETSLVITLLLASFALHAAGRDNWAALTLGLGTLTRPDVLVAALLIFGNVGLGWLFRTIRPGQPRGPGKRFPYRPAAIFAATLLPWVLFATVVYGGPLPHSMAAKSVAYRLPAEAALVRLLQHYGTPFHEHLIFGSGWVLIGLVLYGTLLAIGCLSSVRKNGRTWPLFLYPVVYAAVYSVANPLIFRWYLSPPMPFFFLGILVGVRALAGELAGKRARRWITILAAVLAVASLGNAWTRHPPGPPDRPAPEMAWIELETLYRQVALDLKESLAATGDRLAAGDIGTLGWFTNAPILDLVGLISPQAQEYYPLPTEAYDINYAVPADYVLAEQPEVIVILEVYGRKTLALDGRFGEAYELWRTYPTDIYGSEGMLVYRRSP